MEREIPTKLIAQRVVALVAEKREESLKEAVAVLETFFANQPNHVTRAYELAWLIVLKKNLSARPAPAEMRPNPEADWMAIKASLYAERGDLPRAFSLLRTASNSGARQQLCRSVVFEMFRKLERKNCLTHIFYEGRFGIRTVTTVEVGRVPGSGLFVVRNPGSKFDLKSKRWSSEPGTQLHDAGRIFLKSEEELGQDVDRGSIGYRWVGSVRDPKSFDRIDWSRYVQELCREKHQEPLAVAA